MSGKTAHSILDVPADMKRVVVRGITGTGKSTLARALVGILGGPHIELDGLHFLDGWETRPFEELRRLADAATKPERWVVDGNYVALRDITWARADTLIFLDYPLRRVLWQLTKRSIRDSFSRKPLWGTGNRENFFRHLQFSNKSLYYYAIKNIQRRRDETPALLAEPANTHLRYLHFTDPAVTQAWLENVRRTYRPSA